MYAMDNLTSLNVMNWNGRSLRNKAPELFDFMVLHRIDLAIVTETWLQSNMSFSHGSFSCIIGQRPQSSTTWRRGNDSGSQRDPIRTY